jgi:signal transduction histidine kinase/CheY-like chemotaxis protein/HAMP domain-containing protein
MGASLRTKTILLTTALALVPLLVVSAALLSMSYIAERDDILVQQNGRAEQLAYQVGSALGEVQQSLDVVARTSDWEALEPLEQEAMVDALYSYRTLALVGSAFGAFDEVLLLDKEGGPVAGRSTIRLMTRDAWARDVRDQALPTVLEGVAYRGDVYTSQAAVPTLDIAVPTRDFTGRVTGLLWGGVNLDKVLWPIIAAPGLPDGSVVYVFDGSGQLIARNDEHFFERNVLSSELVPLQEMQTGLEGGIQTYEGLGGQTVIGAWQPVPDTDWTLVVETVTRQAFADIRWLLLPAAVLSLVTIGVAVTVGIVASRRLMQPIETLRWGAEILGSGDLEHRIRVESRDEIGSLAETFNQMALSLKASRQQLERWASELEDRVEERTRELAVATVRLRRRAAQLETSAEVARAIAELRDLDELLPQVTRLISQRFGWYHAGIFLLDEVGEYAVLRAANSEGGQRMLARGHKLRVGQVGIVGAVTGSGVPRIALDVGEDAVYFDNPDLPRTRSEMAVPLKVGEQVFGALDVQSMARAAYDDEDLTLLSNLADQVAIAIENARLFREMQEALEEVQLLHRQYVRQEWSRTIAGEHDLVFQYSRRGVPPAEDTCPPELVTALTEDGATIVTGPWASQDAEGDGDGRAGSALAVPIRLRDQVIGAFDLQDIEDERHWTEDEIGVVEAIADQVALALENARLFADTRHRAEQLATLHRVGLDITTALDLDGVLQALYEQIEHILEVDSFYVALYDESTAAIEFPLVRDREGPLQLGLTEIREWRRIAGHVIGTGRPLHVPDLTEWPEGLPIRPLLTSAQAGHAYVGVPLRFRDKVFGVLAIQSDELGTYTDEDVELLSTIATQASIAIQNARAYERLVGTAEQLREIDRLKTQFLANMSHELRTPLNSIIGFSKVMLKGIDGPLTELQEADLTSIYNSGQHLLELINSILDMSKIEAGKMDLAFDQVRLPDIFDTVLSTTRALVKDRPIQLRSEVPEQLPAVRADTQRVRQVLINLMSNAAKFTEEGSITLKAEAGSEYVTVRVTDTGVGIDAEAQKRLFIPFQQVDASTSRRAGGTGLGLAISRRFVDMMDGEIWVESVPGQGSTFSFTLPIYDVVDDGEEMDSLTDLESSERLVLVVDDDQGVITLLSRYLQNEGYRVAGVTESQNALPMAQRLAHRLAAIVLDVVMPHMDGWAVLEALKADPKTRGVPVILCSIGESLDQGRGRGAVACLQKPIMRDELVDMLRKVAKADSPSPAQETSLRADKTRSRSLPTGPSQGDDVPRKR